MSPLPPIKNIKAKYTFISSKQKRELDHTLKVYMIGFRSKANKKQP
ncbi:hypothetical protein VIRA109638_13205 [Vibrio rarus]